MRDRLGREAERTVKFAPLYRLRAADFWRCVRPPYRLAFANPLAPNPILLAGEGTVKRWVRESRVRGSPTVRPVKN